MIIVKILYVISNLVNLYTLIIYKFALIIIPYSIIISCYV